MGTVALIFDCALDVVDGNVVAEDGPGVGVGLFDGGAGEADKGGVGQGIAHVAGEAVDEVVLAAVGFVSHHNDVPAAGEEWVFGASFLGEEFVDGGEDHAAAGDGEELFEVLPALGLDGLLAEQLVAAGKRAEELVVQVVAVGEHDNSWVFHRRVEDQLAGVEDHGERFAGALGMPDHADTAVAGGSARLMAGEVPAGAVAEGVAGCRGAGAESFLDSDADGVELVIAGHFLEQHAAGVFLEDNEVVDKIEKTPFFKHTAKQDIQLWHRGRRNGLALDGAPWHETLFVGGDGADAGFQAVGDYQKGIVGEDRGDLLLVGLELVESIPDGGVFVGRVFQLEDGQRQAVYEDDDVGAAVVLALDHRELVHHEPVVGVRVLEIDEVGKPDSDGPVGPFAFHGDSLYQHAVEGPVIREQRMGLRHGRLAEGLLQGFRREVRVQPAQGFPEAIPKRHLGERAAFRRRLAWGDISATQ